ncbi:MAG TPA: hypothetical protein VFN21_04640 [Acidimicrobiales bacterium]|nr:hypothetical protein [Acidimicrobiales bacterium]
MTFAKRILAPILLATGLCIAGAACSSSSDDAGSATSTTKAESGASTTTPGSVAPTTTIVGSDPDSAFCVTVKRLNDSNSLDPAIISSPDGPEVLQKSFTELESKAPKSLKSSIRTVAKALDEIVKADAETQEELDAINSKITDEQVSSASTKLETYVRETCGVDLGG